MKATALKLIAFVAVCLSFTLYLAFTIGNIRVGQMFTKSTYKLTATFDDVTGLLPNDNVKVAGVVVGKVTGIHVRDGRAVVDFQVRKTIKVPTDTSAAVRWRNLLGQRYVYLYPGTASTVFASGGHIDKTRSVVDIGELFNRLGPIVQAIAPDKVNQFLDAITQALDGNENKLRQSLDDLATLTARLAQRDQAIGRLVTNLDTAAGTINSRDAEIKAVLDNLVTITTTFSQNTAVLDDAITQTSDFSNNLNLLLGNNRDQVDHIIANLRTLTDVIHSKLPQLDTSLGNLPAATLRMFNAARYGEWLNQTIPCGAVGRNADGSFQTPSTPCNPALSPQGTATDPYYSPAPRSGTDSGGQGGVSGAQADSLGSGSVTGAAAVARLLGGA